MKQEEEHNSINMYDEDIIKKIKLNSKHTDSGCMVYYVNGKPSKRTTVKGKQTRIRRLYYLSTVPGAQTELKKRRLLRLDCCKNDYCIEPTHQRIVRQQLKALFTSFHPVTHEDFTTKIQIPI